MFKANSFNMLGFLFQTSGQHGRGREGGTMSYELSTVPIQV